MQICDGACFNIIVKGSYFGSPKCSGRLCGAVFVSVCYIYAPQHASRSVWVESLGGPMQCVHARLLSSESSDEGG